MAQNSAAFMSEVEDDRRSVASVATTIWDGAQDAPLVQLRASRKAVNVLRRQLLADYVRVKGLDDDDFDDEYVEADTLRHQFGSEVIRHVNLARDIAKDFPQNAEFVLGRVANSVNVFREAWNKTSYFGQVSYGRLDIPSTNDIIKVPSNAAPGEKRQRADLTLSTTVMETGGGVVAPHASSTPEPETVEVVENAVSGGDVFVAPNVPQRRQRPATPAVTSRSTPNFAKPNRSSTGR